MRFVMLWVVGICALLWACGSSERAGPGAAGSPSAGGGLGGSAAGGGRAGAAQAEPVPIEDLCPLFTHDLCVYLMQCSGVRYRDAAHCERELDCYGMNELLAAAASGAVNYDASKVGECHQRFIASPCTFGAFLFTPDIYEVLAYCPGTVTPKLTAGQSCASSGECSDGLYCYKGDDYACPGTCRAPSGIGQACGGSARCTEDLTCGDDDLCAPKTVAGDPCTGFCSYSVSCPGDEICTGNLWCDMSAGQCALGRLSGEACGTLESGGTSSFANCAIHLWCDAGPFTAGTCRAPSDVNGPCNDDFYACKDGLHCSGYVASPTEPVLGTCVGPSAAGGDCNVNDDCLTGPVCVSGLCRTPSAASEPCDGNDDCAPGLLCPDSTCVDAPYPGESCSDTGPACGYSRCVGGTCEYHAKVGESCSAGTDCATGSCVAGRCYDSSVCNAPL